MRSPFSLVIGLAGLVASHAAFAQPFTLSTQQVATGLSRPVFVAAPAGDTSRIFVVEQRSGSTGRVRIVNIPANTLNATPFLSVAGVATGNEQGLLGLAFHPNFLSNGYFFVNYTAAAQSGVSAGSTTVVRYRANLPYATSTTADPASATVLLTILQPDANHNGGWLAFGPEGNLYIATGDGGCGNDTNCGSPTPSINPPGHTATIGNAQDVTANLLGKMLRLDVDGSDNIPGNDDDDGVIGGSGPQYTIPAGNPFNGTNGDREIFMYGLRNPWRPAFDRATGDLWIADVGQGVREEVNFVAAGAGAGMNFGWRCMEGTRCTGLTGCTCNAAGLQLPIIEYGHSGTPLQPFSILGCSITGGYVYRGSAIPCFDGHYIFSDYCSGDIWTVRRTADGSLADITNRTTEIDAANIVDNVTSFGEDASGELYICDQTGGQVFKITGACPPACDPDLNQDGNVDQDDVSYLIDVVGGGPNPTGIDPDFNQDGNVDQDDVNALINTVGGAGCP